MNKLEQSYSEILYKLRRYCALQERCRRQIIIKLNHANFPTDLHADVIEKLESENFLNEERFARLYVRSKFNQKSWGKRKIAQKLKGLGISNALIDLGFEELESDLYKSKMIDLASRKFDSLGKKGNLELRRQKTIRYMLNKGYEMEQVYQSVRSMS